MLQSNMPTALRVDGLRVVLYPNDHRPPHVHVLGAGTEAVFILNCPAGPPTLRGNYGFTTGELNRIASALPAVLTPFVSNGSTFMVITDTDRLAAETRLQTELKRQPKAVQARYDRRTSRVIIALDNGLELAFPPRLAQGLEHATPAELATIEISALGDGLHWPAIDADLYVPALLQGCSDRRAGWLANWARLGVGARSSAKLAAARENGRKGGRPRKLA